MTGVALAVLFLSCLGGGAAVLNGLGLWRGQPALERGALAFATGFGVVGWLAFWIGTAGALSPGPVWGMCGILSFGLVFWNRPSGEGAHPFTPAAWALLGVAALALVFDLFEAASPPIEADTLSYHFELPRRFVEEGRVFFVPRALSGATPLIVQMTYAVALTLGPAESADALLTGWTLISGWGASVLLFALARRWLKVPWALGLALLFQTLPATIYGAGSGHVEPRLALFVLAACVALIQGREGKGLAPAVALGVAAGFYAAGKYTGLLFLPAAGIGLMFLGGRWFSRGAVFTLATLIAGGQWYGWNFVHTGDPVFPMLFGFLGLEDGPYWNADQAAYLAGILEARGRILNSVFDAIAYPFLATLAPLSEMSAGRIGLGPFVLLALPAALIGAWRRRWDLMEGGLVPVAVMVFIFYALWVLLGGVPKVRHLLPLMPPLMLCVTVAASKVDGAARPLALALGLSIALQVAGQGVFTRTHVVRMLGGEDKAAFLARTFGDEYAPVQWINANKARIGRILTTDRHLLYLIDAPTVVLHDATEPVLEIRPGRVRAASLYAGARALGLTHIMDEHGEADPAPATFTHALVRLGERGCLVREADFEVRTLRSITLRIIEAVPENKVIWRLTPETCTLS